MRNKLKCGTINILNASTVLWKSWMTWAMCRCGQIMVGLINTPFLVKHLVCKVVIRKLVLETLYELPRVFKF